MRKSFRVSMMVLLAVMLSSLTALGQATYTWNVASGAWTASGSWSPARTTPAMNDILVFDGSAQATPTVTGVPKETIAQLKFINNVTVTITSGTAGGTGTFSRSGSTVTGVGTSFTTGVSVGDLIYGATTLATYDVTAVTNDLSLTTSQSGTVASQNFAVCPRLTINGDTGTDLDIQSGSSVLVSISAAPGIVINLATSTTALIAGTIKFNNSGTTAVGSRILAADSAAIAVTATGVVEQATATGANTFSGSLFGVSGTANIITFQNGSTFIQRSGSNPFAFSQPSSKVVFNSGSSFKFYLSGTPSLTGRTFGDFIVGNGAASSFATNNLSADCIIYNVTQESGAQISWGTNGATPAAGTLRIRGNVSTQGTFAFKIANRGGSGIIFESGGSSTIGGAGTGTVSFAQTISVASGKTITLAHNVVDSTSWTVNGQMDLGSSVLSGGGSYTVASGATLKSGHASGINGNLTNSGGTSLNAGANYEFNGAIAQVTGALLPVTVNNLTINNTNGVTLSQPTTVNGALTLTSGALDNSTQTLTLGNSAAISRATGNLSAAPTFGTSVDVTYTGSSGVTTGNEIPSSSTVLNNLTINNSGDVTLNASRTVNGTLTLTSGLLTTTGSNTLTLGSSATISGEAAGRYVIGNLTTTKAVGTGSSTLGGIGVSLDAGGADDLGNVTVTRVSGSAGIVANPSDGSKTGIARKWTITSINPPLSGRNVTFTWISNDDNGKTLTVAQVWKSTNSGTTWATDGASSDASSTRSMSVSETSFGDYTVSDAANPLPVELTSFIALARNGKVELNWNTATEVNNYGFEVERKTESSEQLTVNSWKKVGFVEGAGTSSATKNYSYHDVVSSTGKYTYRLKQIDRNGRFTYSKEVEAVVGLTPADYKLSQNYPNPFNPSSTIRFAIKMAGHVTLRVYNTAGQEVRSLFEEMAEPDRMYSVVFDGTGLASGTYFYVLQTPASREVKKMLMLK